MSAIRQREKVVLFMENLGCLGIYASGVQAEEGGKPSFTPLQVS